MDVLVYHQAFDLMKHWGVGLVRIRAVRATGYHYAMRRRAFLHGPNLHRRGVCAQYDGHAIIALRQIEGILHLPGWMFGWDVQGGKIMEIILDVRPLDLGRGAAEAERRIFPWVACKYSKFACFEAFFSLFGPLTAYFLHDPDLQLNLPS